MKKTRKSTLKYNRKFYEAEVLVRAFAQLNWLPDLFASGFIVQVIIAGIAISLINVASCNEIDNGCVWLLCDMVSWLYL